MNSLKAGIYKDICLFLSVSGILSLLLPALVAAALLLGLNDAAAVKTNVEPFPIAIYDRDDTLMSRSLISQLRNVELFSNITVLNAEKLAAASSIPADESGAIEAGDKLFDTAPLSGCAAVITIPYDFFYDAYTGDEEPVSVILNDAMPLEGAITSSLTTSVADILNSERAAWYAAYSLKNGGEFDRDDFANYCADASASILDSALGRRSVIKNTNIKTEISTSVKQSFFTCACSMLLLFVPAGVLKTLPDERRVGLAGRLISIGGSVTGLILSKLIASFILCSAGLAPVIVILRPQLSLISFSALLAAFLAGFALMLALTSVTRSTEQFMLGAGLVTAASLLFGGTIYPAALLPRFASVIGNVTIPKYLLTALTARKGEWKHVLPLVMIAAAALAMYFFSGAVRRSLKARKGAAHA
ncbi:MAG: ABC transporter permease [Clostridia bacterium]|nr:ABC transporter permease [Clostridia bacterium]